ncbi:MAG: hypothetical protein GWM90_18100 [Gemmatimonadetes bacterium]|nr:carbohydrate kinase family protein [Gemmatimonadota bacterium]NIQ56930.1 carbohydrate kinase family protein [Gemmatimonadota bacterium]NIU77104.1 hypothetical protein [Gammaproteobacteria bacterium]NIX45933.1 hypothetical protein [Gemmatimonadota bacterium]NIY10254.1 hypothetical protein [Gemmatimonadota bacterium]
MRLGVLGTMVWDRIEHPDAPTVERWGGLSYSLAAAAAALPAGWELRPVMKVGSDLAEAAHSFLRTLPAVDGPEGILEVPEPNNRVHLRYRDAHHRHECLTGGVPPWSWDELGPRIAGLDALYVNLISGFELELATARRLRAAFDGPLYADLHSLLLGVSGSGDRTPRPLADRGAWLGAFDVVQANETELALVAAGDDPVAVAEAAVRQGLGAVLVTRGPRGADWFAAADAPRPWETGGTAGPVARGTVPLAGPARTGDPTGCGDVWGATCFVALLDGRRLTRAMAEANAAAVRNLGHRGAEGLHLHLRTSR